LGAAMHAAVAARVYPDIGAAAVKMAKIKDETIRPIAANQTVYNQLYADYKALYNYFGRGHNDVMKRLKKIRNQARGV